MIEAYIKARGLQGDRASKIRGHLVMCEPYGEDYQAIREFLQNLIKKKDGTPKYSEKTVTEIIRDYQNYISWTKEYETMIEYEDEQITIEAPEQAKPEMSTVEENAQTTAPQFSNENPEATPLPPVNIEPETPAKKSAGRPRTTGRSEKFTLYMTADTMENLSIIANYDNKTLTDLLNNIVEKYIITREDDINWVKDFERQKEARKLRQIQ